MEEMIQKLHSSLEQRGIKSRIVPIHRLQELQSDINSQHNQKLMDEEFYKERMNFYAFTPPDNLFKAASLIVAAIPRPQTKVAFSWKGKTKPLILPPTYLGYRKTSRQLEKLLTDLLAPEGYHAALALLPLKLLAVRSTLGAYGRNNICYVPGMGSFLQLAAFYSDLPCREDSWQEPVMMDACRKCTTCQHKCPTGAIPSGRYLLHAERCIVFHNEKPAGYSFPAWLDLAYHDCLIGCMHCQRSCPENKTFLEWFDGNEEFTHEETAMLLEGVASDALPAATREKLERLELLDSLAILPRNLGVIFKEESQWKS